MPTLLTRTPPLGRSNWGTGVQPERGPRQLDMPAPAPGRSLGYLNRTNVQPLRTQLNPAYDESQDPVSAPVAAVAPRPVSAPQPLTSLARTPPVSQPPQTAGLTGFALSNTLANAGIYQPGSFGESNAAANGTGYHPPQQTERANPLSGDNNYPKEDQTTAVQPAPFVQRGTSVPQGQDVRPAVGGSGAFRRSFSNPASASAYSSYVRRLFPDNGS